MKMTKMVLRAYWLAMIAFPGAGCGGGRGLSSEAVLLPDAPLSLRAEPDAFSPNNDGKQDSTFFILTAQGVDIDKWSLTVKKTSGQTLRRFTGVGDPPGLLEWDGTDRKSRPLPESVYRVDAEAQGEGFRAASPSLMVRVDNTPPTAMASASTDAYSPSQENPISFFLHAQDNASLEAWSLEVVSLDGAAQVVFQAAGAFDHGSATTTWNGSVSSTQEPAPNGAYAARFEVRDGAGNLAQAQALFSVRTDASRVLENLIAALPVEKTNQGMRAVLPSQQIFSGPTSTALSPASEDLRRRLVALIKAFPDQRVVIEGFVGTGATPAERLELSSTQAWAFYSFLVRSGVSARRLEVRGRGGAAKIQNRLEVTLLKPALAP